MRMGGQRHSPAVLPPGKKRYPLYRRLGGPRGRSGQVRKIRPPDPWTIQPVASGYIDCAMPDHQLPEYVFILTQLVTLRASEACKLQRRQCSFENRSPWKEKYFHTVFLPILKPLNDWCFAYYNALFSNMLYVALNFIMTGDYESECMRREGW